MEEKKVTWLLKMSWIEKNHYCETMQVAGCICNEGVIERWANEWKKVTYTCSSLWKVMDWQKKEESINWAMSMSWTDKCEPLLWCYASGRQHLQWRSEREVTYGGEESDMTIENVMDWQTWTIIIDYCVTKQVAGCICIWWLGQRDEQ
jgi:hypothetical protein